MKHKKIISFEEIKKEREFARELEKCGIKKFFIFTNGCYDLFHAGHASLLNINLINIMVGIVIVILKLTINQGN